MNCCDRNGHNCNQGRICPERFPTRRSIGLERPWDKEAAQRIGDDPEDFWGMFWFIVFIFCVPVFLAWLAGS